MRLTMMAIAVGALACGPRVRDQSLAVKPPFAEASIQGGTLYVQLVTGAKLDDVVALSVAPLRPGMTAAEAQRELGRPIATRSDTEGVFYRFAGLAPDVELAHLTGPGSNGKPWFKWVVVVSPADRRPSQVLRLSLAALLSKAEPVDDIVIHDGQDRAIREAFSAEYTDGQLYDIEWYSIAGIPGG